MITVLHKHYTLQELQQFFSTFDQPDYVSYSLGIRDEDFTKLRQVIAMGLDSKFNFVPLFQKRDAARILGERSIAATTSSWSHHERHTLVLSGKPGLNHPLAPAAPNLF